MGFFGIPVSLPTNIIALTFFNTSPRETYLGPGTNFCRLEGVLAGLRSEKGAPMMLISLAPVSIIAASFLQQGKRGSGACALPSSALFMLPALPASLDFLRWELGGLGELGKGKAREKKRTFLNRQEINSSFLDG